MYAGKDRVEPLRTGWRVKRCLNLLAWLLGFREWLGLLVPGKGYANASFMWAFGVEGAQSDVDRSRFLYKKGLECGMFGSFLALCRSGLGCGRATGFLTWENRRSERKCDLMLRNYATFEGAFAHAYTSHGRIQGLLAKMVASGTMRAWAKSVHA